MTKLNKINNKAQKQKPTNVITGILMKMKTKINLVKNAIMKTMTT